MTFGRRADAVRWLALQEAEIKRADWIDPDRSRVVFGEYAEQWITDRVLKVRTTDLYQALLRNGCWADSSTPVRSGDRGQGLSSAARHLR